MKIIARAGEKVIVEMTDNEFAQAAGHHSVWSMKRENGADARNFNGDSFMIGVKVDVSRRWALLESIRNNERQVKDGARLLRSMAEMMENGIPSALVGFPEEPSDA